MRLQLHQSPISSDQERHATLPAAVSWSSPLSHNQALSSASNAAWLLPVPMYDCPLASSQPFAVLCVAPSNDSSCTLPLPTYSSVNLTTLAAFQSVSFPSASSALLINCLCPFGALSKCSFAAVAVSPQCNLERCTDCCRCHCGADYRVACACKPDVRCASQLQLCLHSGLCWSLSLPPKRNIVMWVDD